MHKHSVLYSFGVAIILSILVFTSMEIVYPRKPSDMFSGSVVITVLAFPVIWFFGLLVLNAIAWWRDIGEEKGD